MSRLPNWMTYRRNYLVVEQADGEVAEVKSKLRQHGQCRIQTSLLIWMLPLFASLAVAFLLGRHSVSSWSPIRLNTVPLTLRYNRTFGEAPSNRTNRAWREIFPSRGTYFSHPNIAPHRSTLSVYHQLHCLDGLRHGYWQAFLAATEGKRLDESEIDMMSSPAHIRHCLDLLRQSLMCNADTTLEEKDVAAGGVHGFGVRHQCYDWKQLERLLGEWQAE